MFLTDRFDHHFQIFLIRNRYKVRIFSHTIHRLISLNLYNGYHTDMYAATGGVGYKRPLCANQRISFRMRNDEEDKK